MKASVDMNITYKIMSSLSFEDAHVLFNRGFEGYIIPMNLSFDAFVSRFGNTGLSPALSIVAYDGIEPIGFVLQGIKELDGQKISWNGGTGIIPKYRGRKLGGSLMAEAEQLIKEQNVTVATLESLSENKPAIALYERCGYKVEDNLLFLRGDNVLHSTLPSLEDYEILRMPADQLIGSNLFPAIVPWQTEASSISKIGGEAMMISKDGEIQGACLIRKKCEFGNKTESITLYQVMENGNEDALNKLLAHALEYDQPVQRTTYNFLKGNGHAVSSLLASGFENTSVSQVFMTKFF
ncbi:GNAT family N-acetyltransferase [Sporosarcina aquimarina]|uniref:GNAT family N-acetyltransferase n=1 Tax=Sporosarcina aquimarina TaxID=114975 RepID=A0ABU4FZJ6_9BACL|nr:GNAT family N-acetyltransferase [Sporosarcina aquimarina]MDW0109525.1 GNAT family N-acetyltransferase [Sporosarcina aquimarina]